MLNARTFVTAAAAAVVALTVSAGAQALDTKPMLTLDMAKKIADACEALQVAKGDWRPINIAIYDDGGNLKLFRRQENAFLGSIKVSQMKAATSSNFPFPSRLFGELAFGKDGQPGAIPGLAFVPGFAAFPGGVPITTASGALIGGVGVSGATGDQDEECAQAGVASIADMLN
ncbi:MAG: heme-binding protein [Alphaproteobacteria bacterium]|jgi:uncharacterized protein GlcG (DUF336 family)|nr:heme-binding protein [Alphaproteobacteria bacterium]MDP6517037.1 heme-binding protein [Alphaproteobacteria bacterium]